MGQIISWHPRSGSSGAVRPERVPQDLCVGGAILSLDLTQAFDRLDRSALVAALRRLQAAEDLISAVIALHDTSSDHLQDSFHSTQVPTTWGIC